MAVSSSAPFPPASPRGVPALVCRLARDAEDLRAHFAVRRQVFVEAQGLFEEHDRDSRDEDQSTLHAVGLAGGHVAGAVRLYPYGPDGLWRGDRLAVLPADRVHRLGALLVRFAVATAGDLGGQRMIARVQLPNVRFFERLGWACEGEPSLAFGVIHQPMAIALRSGS